MTRNILAALLLTSAAAVANAQSQIPSFAPPPPQVVATGHGEAKIAPDRATAMIAVETRAKTAAEAGQLNARKLKAVQDTLLKLGLTKDQISTVHYSVSPDWRYEERTQRLVGYVASNMLRVDIRKLDQVGQIIDASLKAGATNINSVEFVASMLDSARRVAITAAVTRARGDAEAMARAAGGTLGSLLELTTQDMGPRPMMDMAVRSMAAAKQEGDVETPITPGLQTVTAMVYARWQFINR
jgi:uncharacterized protein